MSLDWKGGEVKSNFFAAAKEGINTTMAAAILNAKSGHGAGAHSAQRFVSRLGNLERSIRIIQPARRERSAVAGKWGSIGNPYAPRIEFGFQGQDSLGRSVNAPAFPFLFPAAAAEYPKLTARIRAQL